MLMGRSKPFCLGICLSDAKGVRERAADGCLTSPAGTDSLVLQSGFSRVQVEDYVEDLNFKVGERSGLAWPHLAPR